MKKSFFLLATVALMASCSSDEIVEQGGNANGKEVPILMSTSRKNVTRASNSLEANQHYNFGTWAYKYTTSSKDATVVMDNYLVGYTNQVNLGYYLNGATTWGDGTTQNNPKDHLSPWFYENLGKKQYTYEGNSGLYTKTDTCYMSDNDYQYLRYWDLAYANTNFYCYAPYMAEGVTLTVYPDASATMEFGVTTSMKDGYDEPLNSTYIGNKVDRSLSEFVFGGAKATNTDLQDVNIEFKHMGAQLFIRFYEDIPGYKVKMINLTDGSVSENSIDRYQGIQATPASKNEDNYSLDKYFVTAGGKVTFSADAAPTFQPSVAGSTRSDKNLMFKIPGAVATYPTGIMPNGFAANLTDYEGANHTHFNVIQEKVADSATQSYSWSPTIYYPVAQPEDQRVGFTFHVSYTLIAEDNKETLTVHNATVYVPAVGSSNESIANWQAGNRYIYTFRITRNASGTTNPETEIDPEDPTPSSTKSLYPIVFDQCTILDYVDQDSEHVITNGTSYNQN